jgi:N-acetylmuramoyl-L-alanine amidase
MSKRISCKSLALAEMLFAATSALVGVKPAEAQPAAATEHAPAENVALIVALDSGHGAGKYKHGRFIGFDTGADYRPRRGPRVHEETLNKLLTDAIAEALKDKGYQPVLAHQGTDWLPPKGEKWPDALTKVAPEAAAFISIHQNVNYIAQIIYSATSTAAANFAHELGNNIGVRVYRDTRKLAVLQDSRQTRADGSLRPAVLFETGRLDAANVERITNPDTRAAYAQKIADAIIGALTSCSTGSTVTQETRRQLSQLSAPARSRNAFARNIHSAGLK